MTGQPSETANFELEKYKLDRAHELELNKFNHAIEVEQVKLIILLNGGSATALLTFAKPENGMPTAHLAPAIILWILGLLVGAFATMCLHRAQAEYAKSYRLDRQGMERRFRNQDGGEENEAREALKLALKFDRRISPLTILSLLLFGAGAVSAAAIL